LGDVPADLDDTFSSVLQAMSDLRQSAAQLGVLLSSYNLTPKQMLESSTGAILPATKIESMLRSSRTLQL
jgi:hypothetical protein